jgi:hypothetical protein
MNQYECDLCFFNNFTYFLFNVSNFIINQKGDCYKFNFSFFPPGFDRDIYLKIILSDIKKQNDKNAKSIKNKILQHFNKITNQKLILFEKKEL